ncbi:MAG: hypothetical protein MMC33_009239 [Icmadophila ericetorum]|nr:hypothetical protein [Icmadophila ericetorum]
MDQQDLEDSAGCTFWEKIVTKHNKDSLTTLAVRPSYEGSWCYGPTAASTILHLPKLCDLNVSLCNIDSSWAEGKLSRALDIDKVEFCGLEEPWVDLKTARYAPSISKLMNQLGAHARSSSSTDTT